MYIKKTDFVSRNPYLRHTHIHTHTLFLTEQCATVRVHTCRGRKRLCVAVACLKKPAASGLGVRVEDLNKVRWFTSSLRAKACVCVSEILGWDELRTDAEWRSRDASAFLIQQICRSFFSPSKILSVTGTSGLITSGKVLHNKSMPFMITSHHIGHQYIKYKVCILVVHWESFGVANFSIARCFPLASCLDLQCVTVDGPVTMLVLVPAWITRTQCWLHFALKCKQNKTETYF